MLSDHRYYRHRNGDISVFPADDSFESDLCSYLDFVQQASPYYGRLIQKTGSSLHEEPFAVFDSLPYTTKETYRDVLKTEAFQDVRGAPFVTDFSSGSVAEPVIRVCRANDDLCEQEVTETTFARAGMGPADHFVCIDVGAADIYDFYFRAARSLGVSRANFLHLTSDIEKSVQPLRDLQPTVLLTLPSLLARVWPHLKSFWNPNDCPIKVLITMGESIGSNFRVAVESQLRCKVLSFYGTTEIGGLAGECQHQNGYHFDPRFVIPSIKSPRRADVDTMVGEVAYTTLYVHTQSVIKYEVGDIVRLSLAPCDCGEPTPRLWHLQRTSEDFILAGDKFSYAMFFDAFSQQVPDIDVMSLDVLEPDDPNGAVILFFSFPTSLKPHESIFLDILKNGIFELDSLYRYGFVEFEVCFKPVSQFGGRKTKRLIDRRVEAAL